MTEKTVDMEKVQAWFTKHAISPNCTACRSNEWNVSNEYVEMRVLSSSDVLPNVGVICVVCGYTMFFNAVVMGLLP